MLLKKNKNRNSKAHAYDMDITYMNMLLHRHVTSMFRNGMDMTSWWWIHYPKVAAEWGVLGGNSQVFLTVLPNPQIGVLKTLVFPAIWVISHMLNVWNIYQHVPHRSPGFVGKYTIHGAFGFAH